MRPEKMDSESRGCFDGILCFFCGFRQSGERFFAALKNDNRKQNPSPTKRLWFWKEACGGDKKTKAKKAQWNAEVVDEAWNGRASLLLKGGATE